MSHFRASHHATYCARRSFTTYRPVMHACSLFGARIRHRHMMRRRNMKCDRRHMKSGVGQEIAKSESFLSDLDKKTECAPFKSAGRCIKWLRSRIRAYNKLSQVEQLLGLFQFNLLLAMYQSSSSNLHCKPKSPEVTEDLCLDKARFLVIAHRKQPTVCS